MADYKLTIYCRCGGAVEMDTDSKAAVDLVERTFREVHKGPEHGDCSREECARAFAEAEKTRGSDDD